MLSDKIKKIIEEEVKKLYKDVQVPDFSVESPKKKDFGEYATNIAMILAKKTNKNPLEIAEQIAQNISKDEKNKDMLEAATAVKPGFINFKISNKYLIENLGKILKQKDKFGSSTMGKGQTVVVDYSAPNIAKPMHIGHLRSTIIGQSIYNIYKFLGYKVIGDSHVGDWGTQFGKLIYAYKYWGDKKKIKENPIEEMTKLYVKFHQESETNEDLEESARLETKKLQDKNPENMKIWKFLVRESIKDSNKIYKSLGVKFDYVLGESFYDDMLKRVVEECLQRKIAVESEGAIIINLDKYDLPPFLIRKKDGAYLYTTTDLATAKYRKEKFGANRILYVVANEQALHFRQLFAALDLLDWLDGIKVEHVKFGMVLGPDGKKFSTRKGEIVRLEELIRKAVDMAWEKVEEKNPNLKRSEKKKVAKTVGIGAIKYNDLSQNRMTDISFDWDRMLSFEGNSGPYLQYVYARINSLAEKYNRLYKLDKYNPFDKADFNLLNEEIEKSVMKELLKFPEVVRGAAKENSPHLIALYLYDLASIYNNFYNSVPIIKSDKKIAKARIQLSQCVAIVMKNGLGLLGINVLNKI